MDYRTVAGDNAEDLARKLTTETKRGQWKVIGFVRDGQHVVAFLEGHANPDPLLPEPETPKTEAEEVFEQETRPKTYREDD